MKKLKDLFSDPIRLKKAIVRFNDRFNELSEKECWEWNGQLNDSQYGILTCGRGYSFRAHRFSMSMCIGNAIPDHLVVLHKCDNPKCVNINHLLLGTQKENMEDCKVKKRNSSPPTRYGEDHHNSKFSKNDLLNIISDKRKYKDIANQYGVCEETIGRVKRNTTWKQAKKD